MSRRTDGGPGSKSQPLRAATGGDYGSRQATINQQKAAPLPVDRPSPGSSTPRRGAPAMPMNGVFGPTERPNESPTTGLIPRTPGTTGAVPDVDTTLRILYSIFPHPQILRLIRRG